MNPPDEIVSDLLRLSKRVAGSQEVS